MPALFQHAILFTGHMIDAPGRARPRLPARAEPAARAAIRLSLQTILATHPGPTIGIAGGASGGDILFHELCFELDIPTRLYLALPPKQYLQASVAPAGLSWIARFQDLASRLGPAVQILDSNATLPSSLTRDQSLNLWARTNLWMASEAISLAPRPTLLALWDGKSGDGSGGTADLISTAPSLGIEVYPPIPTEPLFT